MFNIYTLENLTLEKYMSVIYIGKRDRRETAFIKRKPRDKFSILMSFIKI